MKKDKSGGGVTVIINSTNRGRSSDICDGIIINIII